MKKLINLNLKKKIIIATNGAIWLLQILIKKKLYSIYFDNSNQLGWYFTKKKIFIY